jgi:hypothetical protein
VGRASALLSPARWAALAAVLGTLVAYYLLVHHLWRASLWWDIAWLDLVLLPAVFSLVWIVLPAWRAQWLIVVALAFAAVAVVCQFQDLHILGNFAKLGATTFGAFWFLGFFETLSWVVLVAAIIPLVDAYSVWAGPTKEITTNHVETFYALSFAFPAPGELGGANLGLPDLLFFALFLAAADRFKLRRRATWIAMTASFGLTLSGTYFLEVDGLPALPLLAIGFLAANADLLWRMWREQRGDGRATREPRSPAHRESAGEDPPP